MTQDVDRGLSEEFFMLMDQLKEYGLIYGTSICYTSANVEAVTYDEFLDLIIDKGCIYSWHFNHIPMWI